MKISRGFASDNNAAIHPEILKSIVALNSGHVRAYGDDEVTLRVENLFKKHFGKQSKTFFVFNGTAANVLGISSMVDSFNGVICSKVAHIAVDECGAPEFFTGCKLITIETPNGKLTPEMVSSHMHGVGDQHHVQPKVISISQSTELGTVYSVKEIKALSKFAHSHGMYLHMDGARISNAAASLNINFKQMTTDAGVDVLSFGGTKIGLLCGEAVVFLNQKLARNFKFRRKQGMQLASKMRFIAGQFEVLLEKKLWFAAAKHANKMAKLLAQNISQLDGLQITQGVDANGVFVKMPEKIIKKVQKKYFFYIWNSDESVVRLMTSFDTTKEDVHGLTKAIAAALCE